MTSTVDVFISDLTGAALDWAVARIQGQDIVRDPMAFTTGANAGYWTMHDMGKVTSRPHKLIGGDYSPSTDWALTGPIMHDVGVFPKMYGGCAADNPDKYACNYAGAWQRGPTPLIAFCRSYVQACFSDGGDMISIPVDLHKVKD